MMDDREWPPRRATPARAYEPAYAFARDGWIDAARARDASARERERERERERDGDGDARRRRIVSTTRLAPFPSANALASDEREREATREATREARARDRRAGGDADDGDGDARVEGRRGGAIGGAATANGKTTAERALGCVAVGGSSQEGAWGGLGWGHGLGIVESGAMDAARGTPRESRSRSQTLAGFDNRRRDGRVATGSTPTLDASAPSALRVSSQNVPRGYRISPEMAPVSRDADLETPMWRDAFVAVERRVRALESTRDDDARDVKSLKSMITDIMTTQANLLAMLASRPPTFVVPPERLDDRPRRSRSPSADAKSASSHPRADDARKRPRAAPPRADVDVDVDADDASDADVEVSESQLRRVVLRRMLLHQRGAGIDVDDDSSSDH